MAKVRDPLLDTTEGMEIFTSLQGARGVSVNTLIGNPGYLQRKLWRIVIYNSLKMCNGKFFLWNHHLHNW